MHSVAFLELHEGPAAVRVLLNASCIEAIGTVDGMTVIRTTSGSRMAVTESADDLVQRIQVIAEAAP